MAEKYEQLLQQITKTNTESATVAIDYLEGDMKGHMEALMACQLDKWSQRGFIPLYENPTRILIERSAKSYKEPPKRSVTLNGAVSEVLTASYNDLLATTELNFTTQDLDQRARLLTSAIILPQVAKTESEVITLTVLSRNNCAVYINPETREMEQLLYTAGVSGANGGMMFHYWDKEVIIDIEDGNEVGREENPYGIIPAAILNDTRPPLSSNLWRYPSWEQLIQFSDGVNLFNTEALFNARYGMVGSPITNMKIPDGFVRGIDTALELEGTIDEVPFFEYRTPTVNITSFLDWLNKFKEAIADEWGVNLKFAGGSIADSGFKLVVEEFENIELRQTRIVAAKQFEQDLYQVFAAMSVIHDWGLNTDGVGVADFKEPALPVNEQNDWIIAKEQIALGVITLEDYWLKKNPDLTAEQLAEKRVNYDRFRGLAGNVPEFEEA